MRFSDSELLDCERNFCRSLFPDKKLRATLRSPDSIYGLAELFLA